MSISNTRLSQIEPKGKGSHLLHFFLCSFLIASIFTPMFGHSAETETSTAADSTPEYNTLTNKSLTTRANNSFREARKFYLSEKRALAKAAFLLEKAREDKLSYTISHAIDNIAIVSSTVVQTELTIEQTKDTAESARGEFEKHKRKAALIQAEYDMLHANIQQINNTLSALVSLRDTINSLQLPLLEIGLRVEDGTLAKGQVPKDLTPESIQAQQAYIKEQTNVLKTKGDEAQRQLKVVTVERDDIDLKTPELETAYNTAKNRLSEALKRQGLLQEFAEYESQELVRTLTQMQGEMIGLSGTFQISANRFNRTQRKIDQVEAEIASLERPESVPTSADSTNPEEIEHVLAQIGEFVAYEDQNLGLLRSLRSHYTNLGKQGQVYQGDAAVLNDHVFKMLVPAMIIEDKLEEGEFDSTAKPDVDIESLSNTKLSAEQAVEQAANGIKVSAVRLAELGDEISKSRTERQEAEQLLVKLGIAVEAANQARQWSSEISDLPAEEVVARFNETKENQITNEEVIAKASEKMEAAYQQSKIVEAEFDSLVDPLLRRTQSEYVNEKQAITKKLYSFTDLELPVEEEAEARTEAATLGANAVEQTVTDTQKYQNLLTTRSHIIASKGEKREEFVATLAELRSTIEAYASAISEKDTLTQKQYANAIELKTRIGRRQVKEEDIPVGITEALNREGTTELEQEIMELNRQSASVERKRARLAEPHETLNTLRTLLDETTSTMGRRLDVIKDLNKLETELARDAENASAIEITSLEQSASRRLEGESSRKEWLLGYVPSSRADHITNVLKVYYQELIELEQQRINIADQASLTQRIIELVEEEKTAISGLTPLLQKEKNDLKAEEDDAWVTAQAAFNAEGAAELISQYEAKTNRRLSIPPAVLDEEKMQTLELLADQLFFHKTEVIASDKWIQLFSDRLSESGLEGEIAKYQEFLGALRSRASAIERRIGRISGHTPAELEELAEADRPKSEAETQLFLRGEVGQLRAERIEIQSQSIVQLVARIVVIWVIALILTLIFSRIIKRMTDKHKDSESGTNAQTLLVLSFVKTVGKIIIWITAIILIFSSLGFNVGAVLAGLGIGGLAIAMAARETLSDLLGGIMIFIERPFVIGDVVKIGNGSTTSVVDMTWRSTLLRTPWNYTYSTPNSQVANSVISNFTKIGPTMDFMPVYLSPEYDPWLVQDLIGKAVESVDIKLGDEGGCTTGGIVLTESSTVMKYWPWWYVETYASRGKYRGAIWKAIWDQLTAAGIKMEIKPIERASTDSDSDDSMPPELTKLSEERLKALRAKPADEKGQIELD